MSENKLASEKDVLDAIKDLLGKSGHLKTIRSKIRANITNILQQRNSASTSKESAVRPPPPSDEVLLINDLVREFLTWNGYLYTSSVLGAEAAMPKGKKTREQLCEAIGVRDDEKSATVPLLTNIVAAYTERIQRKLNKIKMENAENSVFDGRV